MMNKRQKGVLWAAVLLFVVSLAFPPYFMGEGRQSIRYAPYFLPPRLPYAPGTVGLFGERTWPAFVDTEVLHWQWVVLALLATTALVMLADGRRLRVPKRLDAHAGEETLS